MRNTGRLLRTIGKKQGQCNICGETGPLTEDHSPPKSCVKPTAVQIRHIVELLSGQGVVEKGRISQNGVKFRTLCHRCNNDLLGLCYDPPLASFTKQVSQLLSSYAALPATARIQGNPQRIMRAVFGHLAAQGVDRYLKGPETEELRDWFANESLPLPQNIRIYYWPFPHHGSIIFRDAAYLDIPSGQVAVIWLLKFYPISFLISWEESSQPLFSLPRLSDWGNEVLSKDVALPISLTEIPHRYWPEAPSETSVMTFGQEAMFAVPHINPASR